MNVGIDVCYDCPIIKTCIATHDTYTVTIMSTHTMIDTHDWQVTLNILTIHLFTVCIGDHISMPGEQLRVSGHNVYRHHMIVVKVISWNKLRVIHYSKAANANRATITEEDIVIDPYNDVIYRINYDRDESYTGQEAIDRALERADESSYNLLFNNCESFCTWVKVNKNKSSQAETGMGLAVGAAVVGTVAVLSFAVFKAFKSANKSSK